MDCATTEGAWSRLDVSEGFAKLLVYALMAAITFEATDRMIKELNRIFIRSMKSMK